MTRRGFTLIELLTVVLILAVLSGIGLFKYIDIRNTARTAALAADFRAVTVATLNFYADREAWPAEAAPGVVPTGLQNYLPGGLAQALTRPEYTLDYDNIQVDDAPLIAIGVTTADTRLMAKFIATFATQSPFFLSGGKLSYLIAGPGGVF